MPNPEPIPIETQLAPPMVRVQWCSFATPHNEPYFKDQNETFEAFADRVGVDVTLKLRQYHPTADCSPPYPPA